MKKMLYASITRKNCEVKDGIVFIKPDTSCIAVGHGGLFSKDGGRTYFHPKPPYIALQEKPVLYWGGGVFLAEAEVDIEDMKSADIVHVNEECMCVDGQPVYLSEKPVAVSRVYVNEYELNEVRMLDILGDELFKLLPVDCIGNTLNNLLETYFEIDDLNEPIRPHISNG